MFKDKKILVTGAAGFIGSNLVDVLLTDGARVIGIDNMYTGHEIMRDVDIVFHEAAFTSVPQSIAMPQFCHDVNVTGNVERLECCKDTKHEQARVCFELCSIWRYTGFVKTRRTIFKAVNTP